MCEKAQLICEIETLEFLDHLHAHKFCTFLFVFVLMGWSLLPNALRPFQIYCTPPNLRIART